MLANRSSAFARSSDPENPSCDLRLLLDFVESETSVGCYSPDDHLHRSCDSAIDVSPLEMIRDSFVRHVASENCAGLENCVCGNESENENEPDDPYDAPKDCDSSFGSCDVAGETCFDLYPDFDPSQQAMETCDGVAVVVVVVVGMSPFVDGETDLDVELERSFAVPEGNVCERVLQVLEMLRDDLAAEIPFPWREVLCRDSNGRYSDHDHLVDLRVAQILPRNYQHLLRHSSVGFGQDDETDRVIRDVFL